MLIMTRKRTQLYGYISRKLNNCEIAALMDDLDLVPEIFITPSVIELYRDEMYKRLKERLLFDRDIVKLAIEYTFMFLDSDYGKSLIRKYHEKFSLQLPLNR